MTTTLERSSLLAPRSARSAGAPRRLDPDRLSDHVDAMFRAAWAMCGSRHDAEDLVQETIAKVLKRPRILRDANELGYLLRALRNTYASRYRIAAARPAIQPLVEGDVAAPRPSATTAREIMEAIAGVPEPYRDAVIAVDLIGLSYREAASATRVPVATLTTRLHRGRQHAARGLLGETVRHC